MIIDIHAHIFPDSIAEKTVQVLKSGIKNIQGIDFDACSDATFDGICNVMEKSNVDISVIQPIVTNPKSSNSINSFAKSISESKRLISFGGIHPLQDNIDTELKQLKDDGFAGIKLHPEFQKFYIDSPEAIKLFKSAEDLNLSVLIHSGEDIGLPPPVHCTPERLKNLLQCVSGKNIIAAHLGGWKMWDDVEKYLVGESISFDTAFISKFISREQCKRIIKNHGADKILFGSDFPWENPKDTLNFLYSLGLSDEDIEKITYKNASVLLNIGKPI